MTKPIYKVYNDQYVAAVIQGSFELGQWLISVPKERLDGLKIESMTSQKGYPVTLIEGQLGKKRLFIHSLGPADVMKKTLQNMSMKILATYTIRENFYGDPKNPGLDYMGILDHEHEGEDE